jgi:putative (di)nucleoside polyphosphate hydrolase
VNIATEHPEFKSWQWVAPETLPEIIVAFKKPLYEQVLAAFASQLK